MNRATDTGEIQEAHTDQEGKVVQDTGKEIKVPEKVMLRCSH